MKEALAIRLNLTAVCALAMPLMRPMSSLCELHRTLDSATYTARYFCILDDVRTEREVRFILGILDSNLNLICGKALPETWSAFQKPLTRPLLKRFVQARERGKIIDASRKGWKTAVAEIHSVQWIPQTAKLVFQHRRVRDGDIYFIVNEGEPFNGEVLFPHQGLRAELWDADTGEIRPIARYSEEKGRILIPLSLNHFESALVSFSEVRRPIRVVTADGGQYRFDGEKQPWGYFTRSGNYRL